MGNKIINIAHFIVTMIFAFMYIEGNNDMLLVLLFVEYVLIACYGIKDINKHITLLVFLVSFYTFMMGRTMIPIFMETNNIYADLGNAYFKESTTKHIYLCLYLALIGVYVGYVLKYRNYIYTYDTQTIWVEIARKKSKQLIYFIYPFVVLLIAEKILYVIINGYFAFYIDFSSRLPYIVTILASMFDYVVLFFLATLPSKKETKIPIALYLSCGFLNLGTGQRGEFVLSILLIISYFFLRNTIVTGEKKWITKKGIIGILASIPFFLIFLFAIAYVRTDRDSETSYNFLVAFLYQQGVSVDVIGYGFEYMRSFPEGRFYLLGDIIDYFRHNFIAKLLWGADSIVPQSIEHALNDNAYDATLTYLVKPHDYLNGVGMGSCYIAEAWHDLGYLGVVLLSFLYGRVLALIPKWLRQNYWKGTMGLLMYYAIIYSPRSRADKPLYIFVSLVVVIVYLYLYYAINRKKSNFDL